MKEMQQQTKKVFFSGVLLLSFSTFLVKIIGFLYKIPMLSYLGSEGMGYFHSAYEIYTLFCVIATAGLPVALSVLVADALAKGDIPRVEKIYRAAFLVFFIIGVIGSILMWIFARQFCAIIQSERAYQSILSIAPTIFFVCLSSAVRGYFQGHQRMLQTAVSQMIEAIGKLIFGLLFAKFALEQGGDTAFVASCAGWGLSVGTAISTIYLLVEKYRFTQKEKQTNIQQAEYFLSYRHIWRRLARLAVPMTFGSALVSITKLVDMTMILRRLQAIGYSEMSANEAYGSYTTLALSVFGLLPTLLNSVALPLVPMLSSAIAAGDREKQTQMVETSYRTTSFFAIPVSVGIAAFARPVLSLLFQREPQAVEIASPLLSMLGVSIFLSCMITATNSVLHAYQCVNRPILSMALGAVVKIVSAYFLIGSSKIGLMGAPISTFLCNLTVLLLNLYFASAFASNVSVKKVFFAPLPASLFSVGIAFGANILLTRQFGNGDLVTFFCIALAAAVYLLLEFFRGAIPKDVLSLFSFGKQLQKMKKIKK